MRTLYFECNMGAAGDMLAAALLELHGDPAGFLDRFNGIGIPGVAVAAEPSIKCGIRGTHLRVKVNGLEETAGDEHKHPHSHHEHGSGVHEHSAMRDIEGLIAGLAISERVKGDALAVYNLIADAESNIHGVPVDEIHFHEVGSMDAVADIVCVCMLLEELAPYIILSSPVCTGNGQVSCAHGVLPVPAPATARILEGVPIYGGDIRGELCTPTGAALLKYFACGFGAQPVMRVVKTGYGMGSKDFPAANCVRAFLGESGAEAERGEVMELRCNIDDMTPEALAFAQGLLLDEGALDVYTTAIGMKKGRMGVLLTCLCEKDEAARFVALIFKHTTTLGLRETLCGRYILPREQGEFMTEYGSVRVKTSFGYGVVRSKPEYEDIAKIAREYGLAFNDVIKEINSRGKTKQ